MNVRVGSLFSGYGGLDEGVIAALGEGTVAWHVEFADGPAKVLAYHHPTVPNHVDVTTVDWTAVDPIDVLTGGFPCQDVSLAGARKGLKEGTRSGLWSHFAIAIDALRPRLVVIENVRGLLSAAAGDKEEFTDEEIGDLESAAGVMGGLERSGRPVLRALGAVLGDLAELGYDTDWCGLRAADAGAPHGRFRVFILAYPEGQPWGVGDGNDVPVGRGALGYGTPPGGGSVEDSDVAVVDQRGQSAPGYSEGGRARSDAGRRSGTFDTAAGGSAVGYAASSGRDHAQPPVGGDERTGSVGGSDQPATTDADGQRRGEGWAEPAGRGGRLAPVVGGSTDADAASTRRPDAEDPGTGRRDAGEGPRGVEPERGGGKRVATSHTGDVGPERRVGQPEGTPAVAVDPATDADGAGRGEQRRTESVRPELTTAEHPGDDLASDTGGARVGQLPGGSLEVEAGAEGRHLTNGPGGLRPATDWGPYRPAVERWEAVTGRLAPDPTNPDGRGGSHRLSAQFVEWMMGLELGHVTDPRIGLSRNEQLKALGNGVVPAQAALAVRVLLQRARA